MGWKTEIPASGDMCPCGAGAYNRFSICDEEKTDGLHLHYDICSTCGFETYAHVEPDVKLERFCDWGQELIGRHTEARLDGERIMRRVNWLLAGLSVLGVIAIILKVVT